MFSKKTIDTVKATVPVLEIYGEEITAVFYKNLFNTNPNLKDMFNMTSQKKGTQPRALAAAVLKYGAHIDKLEALGPMVETIAQKHTSLQVTKEMYPIVGEHLLGAIKEVLGDAATDDIMNAWQEAYEGLAAIFVSREKCIYNDRSATEGGFEGMKSFRIAKIVQESDVIKSFYLERADGSKIPPFQSGQYIAVQVEIPNTNHKHTRNYSLSDFGDKNYLRLSIKKETGNTPGVVSNHIHENCKTGDLLLLSMPSGNFILHNKESQHPIVLVAAGIGVTPLLSMYKDLLINTKRKVVFIQCAINGKVQGFKKEIENYQNENVKYINILSAPNSLDITQKSYAYQGYISEKILQENISIDSEFYFCGPKPFMASLNEILTNMGVQKDQINFEFFGSEEDLQITNKHS